MKINSGTGFAKDVNNIINGLAFGGMDWNKFISAVKDFNNKYKISSSSQFDKMMEDDALWCDGEFNTIEMLISQPRAIQMIKNILIGHEDVAKRIWKDDDSWTTKYLNFSERIKKVFTNKIKLNDLYDWADNSIIKYFERDNFDISYEGNSKYDWLITGNLHEKRDIDKVYNELKKLGATNISSQFHNGDFSYPVEIFFKLK